MSAAGLVEGSSAADGDGRTAGRQGPAVHRHGPLAAHGNSDFEDACRRDAGAGVHDQRAVAAVHTHEDLIRGDRLARAHRQAARGGISHPELGHRDRRGEIQRPAVDLQYVEPGAAGDIAYVERSSLEAIAPAAPGVAQLQVEAHRVRAARLIECPSAALAQCGVAGREGSAIQVHRSKVARLLCDSQGRGGNIRTAVDREGAGAAKVADVDRVRRNGLARADQQAAWGALADIQAAELHRGVVDGAAADSEHAEACAGRNCAGVQRPAAEVVEPGPARQSA